MIDTFDQNVVINAMENTYSLCTLVAALTLLTWKQKEIYLHILNAISVGMDKDD